MSWVGPTPAGGEDISVAMPERIECIDDRSLLVADHPHFLKRTRQPQPSLRRGTLLLPQRESDDDWLNNLEPVIDRVVAWAADHARPILPNFFCPRLCGSRREAPFV